MFEEILVALGATLDRKGLGYMVIGGQAVLLYGEPRLTRDIDVTLGVGIERLPDLLQAVRDLSLQPLPEDVEDFVRKTLVLPVLDNNTGIRIDFIFSYTTYETEAIRRARTVVFPGGGIARFASPEDIVVHKVFAGRPRDLEDVRSILLKVGDLDLPYIRRWLAEFDEAAEEKRFVLRFDEILNSLEE